MFVSPVADGEYGVRARKTIPAGTMIGFYEGTPMRKGAITHHNDYIMDTPGPYVIDASGFLSGFGRYINCARTAQEQNITYEKVRSKRVTRRVVMVATVDIFEGSELFVQYGPEYWTDKLARLPVHDSHSRRFCNKMLKVALKDTVVTRRHNEYITPTRAQELKEEFEGSVSEDDDVDVDNDSDYTD